MISKTSTYTMSDNYSVLNNEVIDNLVSVVNLEKKLNSTSYKEADLSLEKLKSICQELLLRLHPDKKGSSNQRFRFNFRWPLHIVRLGK